ncbi:unnamed protein product [Pedinophyceae sp. YPF-701]|nr:unnamed protein product [Pedinophyceae sp. YPF-701]
MTAAVSVSNDAYLPVWRPWFALYNVRLKPPGKGAQTSGSDDAASDASDGAPAEPEPLFHRALPEELKVRIFSELPGWMLGVASCVCTRWRDIMKTDLIWRSACMRAWPACSAEENQDICDSEYAGEWKRMWLERTRLRHEGLYVSRNTYLRSGLIGPQGERLVALALYFRVWRFFPDGTCLLRSTPLAPREVVRHMHRRLRADGDGGSKWVGGEGVIVGSYLLDKDRLYVKLRYDNSSRTEIRWKMRLRSTVKGAHNRLDVLSLSSYDRVMDEATPLPDGPGGGDSDEEYEGYDVQSHSRGTNTVCFIPWERIPHHDINLSIKEMDTWIPG